MLVRMAELNSDEKLAEISRILTLAKFHGQLDYPISSIQSMLDDEEMNKIYVLATGKENG